MRAGGLSPDVRSGLGHRFKTSLDRVVKEPPAAGFEAKIEPINLKVRGEALKRELCPTTFVSEANAFGISTRVSPLSKYAL